jgi:hypothetical protein
MTLYRVWFEKDGVKLYRAVYVEASNEEDALRQAVSLAREGEKMGDWAERAEP